MIYFHLFFFPSTYPPSTIRVFFKAVNTFSYAVVCCVSLHLLKAEAKTGLDVQDNYWERKAKVRELSDPDSGLAPVGWTAGRRGCGAGGLELQCSARKGLAMPRGSLSPSHPLEESCVLLDLGFILYTYG